MAKWILFCVHIVSINIKLYKLRIQNEKRNAIYYYTAVNCLINFLHIENAQTFQPCTIILRRFYLVQYVVVGKFHRSITKD